MPTGLRRFAFDDHNEETDADIADIQAPEFPRLDVYPSPSKGTKLA
jgi:hypothetical protein